MKILAISTSFSRGGAGITAKSILSNQENCKRFLLSPSIQFNAINIFQIKSIFFILNVLIFRLFGISGFINCKFFYQYIENNIDKFDIIHIHNTHGYNINERKLFKLLIKSNKKIIITAHDFHFFTGGIAFPYKKFSFLEYLVTKPYPFEIFPHYRSRRLFFSQFCKESTPTFVFPSQSHIDEVKLLGFSYDESKMIVINNGIFDDNYKPNIINEHCEIIKFIFIADKLNNKIKGLNILLNAVNKLTIYNFQLFIVGEGKSSNQDPRIIFTGHLGSAEIFNLMSLCHVYISPSLAETFGRTIIESIANGLDVICTNLPVFKELLGEHADYFFNGDSEALSLLMIKKINNSTSYMDRVKRAHFFINKYSLSKMNKKYFSLYNKITK
jgi:glycosyltransferase involved in cell wall biosynthesis